MKNTSCIEVLNSCDSSRRDFLKTTSVGLTLAAAGPLASIGVAEKKKKVSSPETLTAKLYKGLNEKQRKAICFPWEHPLRSAINNNWHITKTAVGDMEDDQIDLVKDIFNGLHSPEYQKAVYDQVVHDSADGFEDSAVAIFGEPGSGKFEFVFTGRHVTRRCDGDSLDGAAFGGPIFYGHAAKGFNEKPDHEDNAYWFQAKRTNELFQALDGKQRKTALLGKSRGEHGAKTVKLTGKKAGLPGLRAADMSKDQKGLMREVMTDMLAPFRKKDADESMKLIEKNGFDNLHIAYYKDEDLGKDEVWDVWQVEGPAMIWYFRGAPHVHTWLHIRDKA
ncbi:MAG: DUF3500 domain-containing protein [Verrucomicrobiota bacterium]|nr:DUF3500 domain-containing protein [Verrucomicrobiota bacterium]